MWRGGQARPGERVNVGQEKGAGEVKKAAPRGGANPRWYVSVGEYMIVSVTKVSWGLPPSIFGKNLKAFLVCMVIWLVQAQPIGSRLCRQVMSIKRLSAATGFHSSEKRRIDKKHFNSTSTNSREFQDEGDPCYRCDWLHAGCSVGSRPCRMRSKSSRPSNLSFRRYHQYSNLLQQLQRLPDQLLQRVRQWSWSVCYWTM